MPEPPEPPRRTPPPAPSWVAERWLAPFFRDSGLWPVTAVVGAHLVLAVAVLLLELVRSPGPFAAAALAALALAAGEALRRDWRRRRLGPLGGAALVCWTLGALAAWAADRSGLY